MGIGNFLHKMLPEVVWDSWKWLWERRYTLVPTVMAGLVATYQWLRSQPIDFWLLILVCVGSFLWLLGSHSRGISSKLGEEILSEHTTGPKYLWSLQVTLLMGLFVYCVYLHVSLREVRHDLSCFAARGLMPDQFAKIVTYLKDHKPDEVQVSWLSYDKTSSRYAERLREAFREGDWLVSVDSTPEHLLSGVTIFYRSNEATQKANQNRRRSAPLNPGEVMQEALKGARLRGSDVPNYSPVPDPQLKDHEYKVTVTIGPGPYLLGCDETGAN